MMKRIRTYQELVRLPTLKDRYDYLKLGRSVGESTFGFDRYLNQMLYTSRRWKLVRDEVLNRDNGWDLGVEGFPIGERIIVHHMNPLSVAELEDEDESMFDLNFLISASHNTHNAIHFSDSSLLPKLPVERRPGDTCPWRR